MENELPKSTSSNIDRIIRIEAKWDSDRLDKFLSTECVDISRSRLQHLILNGYVKVDGSLAKSSLTIRTGQNISLTIPKTETSDICPQKIPLTILHEDSDLMVINKQAGLPVHPSPGHPNQTLVNAILAHCNEFELSGDHFRPGIVHRLDKNTSGLIVVAKNEKTHDHLSKQFMDRKVNKVYSALVNGNLIPLSAIIDAPIGRDPNNRKRMAIANNGRKATTEYTVISKFTKYTLIDVKPITGRTHQIRVHMLSIGHPLTGDEIYGTPHKKLNRQFLHAISLGFKHPVTQKYIEFKTDLPDDLNSFLNSLE